MLRRLLCSACALLCAVACSGPVPIPDAPGLLRVDPFVGAPARPRPLPPRDVILHTWLATPSESKEALGRWAERWEQ